MSSIFSCVRKNSSTPLLRTMRSFSLRMTSMSKVPVCTSDLANTFSASSAVSPNAASMTCSRSCPAGGALLGTMVITRSRIVPISANSGSGYSTTAISLSHSGGMTSTGEMRKTVFSVSLRLRPTSRRSRTNSGFLVKACRSRRMKTARSSFFASSTKRSALTGAFESASMGAMGPRMVPSAWKVDQTASGRRLAAPLYVRYRREVEFTAHQDQMALQRLRDQGGFNGDRIADCALATVYASGSDWLKVVVEKTDLSQSNLAGTRIRESTFAHTALRNARLRGARLERVELYFCDLNEVDASELSARRTKVHGSEAMNAVFSGAQLAVTRFEDTKLYRARFDQALLVRVVFLDSRLGGAPLENADFSGARLLDV